jgi:general secretion pathway protein D
MRLKQSIFLGIIFLIFSEIFSSLPLADLTQINQGKNLKNNILNSVKGNTPTPVTNPVFTPQPIPKTTVSMPVVSDKTFQAKQVEQSMPKAEAAQPVAVPKKQEVTITDSLPKLQDEQNVQAKNIDDIVQQNMNTTIRNDMIKKSVAQSAEPKEEPSVLYQNQQMVQDAAMISFNFEDASLTNLLSYIESVFNIRFITDDIIVGAKDAKGVPVPVTSVAGHKINFRTNKNLTFKEAWDLFTTFMHISGFNIIPMTSDRFYRVVPVAKSMAEAIPTYIGVDHNVLPDSEMIVRYVYFTKNIMDLTNFQKFLKNFQSGSAKLDVYSDLRGLIFTDRSSSIKSLMQIVTEFDKGMTPEVVSVIRLKRANADDVIKLYDALKPQNPVGVQQGAVKIWSLPAKESSLDYFPSDVNLVSYKPNNSLIVLGAARDVKRVEDFITKYIDIEIDKNTPPIFTYKLQYTNAKDLTDLITQIVSYGASTDAGKYGGVRDGLKYFQKMNIVADTYTNSLIINATPEDFEAIKPLIEELDVPQKQVGIEVLMVQVKDADVKTIGSQISGPNGAGSPVVGASPYGPTLAQSITAQTSGIPTGTNAIVTQGLVGQDDLSLKSSLASLLGLPAVNEIGSVLLTFGRPIWAVFKILKTITSTHIIANPFLVVSNNMQASITSGESRRQTSSNIVAGSGSGTTGTQVKGLVSVDANLTVKITPQINKANIINLTIDVTNGIFTQPAVTNNAINGDLSPRDIKEISTKVSVANGETLVLGGIMTENFASESGGVPFLSSIPVFGWFFKSKTRTVSRNHFMIFICPRLLDPLNDNDQVDKYTQYKLQEVKQHLDLIDESDWFAQRKDPIQRAFFGSETSQLQQLYTSDTYEQREKLDGRIDNPQNIGKRKKSKKSKYKKNIQNQEPLIQPNTIQNKHTLKNSISGSVTQAGTI